MRGGGARTEKSVEKKTNKTNRDDNGGKNADLVDPADEAAQDAELDETLLVDAQRVRIEAQAQVSDRRAVRHGAANQNGSVFKGGGFLEGLGPVLCASRFILFYFFLIMALVFWVFIEYPPLFDFLYSVLLFT